MSRPLRVLHLTSEYPPLVHGGLGRYVDELTRAQAAAGSDVAVLAPAAAVGRAAPARERRHGVDVRRVEAASPAPDGLLEAVALLQRRMVAACDDGAGNPPDVVHAHDWMVAQAGAELARRWRRPLVLGVHATESGRRAGRLDEPVHRAVHAAERAAIAAADAVVVCSAAMVREVVDHGADLTRVTVVPGGVDAGAWDVAPSEVAAERARWVAPGERLVVAAGRLEWEKGFSTPVRALPELVRRVPSGVRLVLAGEGSYRPTLEALAHDVGAAASVAWAGRLDQPRLAALLAAADVVVVPSRYEPFGLVAREAQAAGVAVVATDAGGLASTVVDGLTGRTIGVGDVDALADVLAELLDDVEQRQGLAGAGRADACRATWAFVADRLDVAYRALAPAPGTLGGR